MNQAHVICHLARADFLERVRHYRFGWNFQTVYISPKGLSLIEINPMFLAIAPAFLCLSLKTIP
jgi:hypothetical protein